MTQEVKSISSANLGGWGRGEGIYFYLNDEGENIIAEYGVHKFDSPADLAKWFYEIAFLVGNFLDLGMKINELIRTTGRALELHQKNPACFQGAPQAFAALEEWSKTRDRSEDLFEEDTAAKIFAEIKATLGLVTSDRPAEETAVAADVIATWPRGKVERRDASPKN